MSTFPQRIRAIGATLDSAADVARECEAWADDESRLISDGAARAIASWWQSAGHDGRHFAALASGLDVAPTDLFVNLERALDNVDRATRNADTFGEPVYYSPSALLELQALEAWARDRASVFVLWHGGANYAPGYIADDLELFPTLEDAEIECDNRYRSGHFANAFHYITREPAQNATPNVDTSSEMHVWLSDPRDSDDPYPDFVIRYDAESDDFGAERA